MALAPEDEAGAAALGSAAVSVRRIAKLPIDTPRAVLIDVLNTLIKEFNDTRGRLYQPLSIEVDADGWEVQTHGEFKRYFKTITFAATDIGAHARATAATLVEPAGTDAANFRIFCSWEGGYAGHAAVGSEANSGTGWEINLGNTYTGTLNFAGQIHVMLEEIPA